MTSEGAATAGDARRVRGRFAPGFVVIAALACLPPALLAGPGGRVDVAFLVGAAVLAAGGLVAQRARARLDGPRRELIGVIVLLGASALLVALVARSALPAHDLLGHLAALQVTTAAIRRTAARTLVQGGIIGATGLLLTRDVATLPGVEPVTGLLGPLALLVAVTVVASALAGDLERARRSVARIARRTAFRAELLDTVREVAHAGHRRALDATVEALIELGFDVAAVGLVQGDDLVPERVVGLRWHRPLSVDHPQAVRVLRATRPIVYHDYATEVDAVTGVGLGTVLLAPVRAEGRTLAVLVAGRRAAGAPDDADVEITDVLASHLGAALLAERAELRQRELLARLRELEHLREGFVLRVTDDLRDPLTVVRIVAQGLATHADRLGPERRAELADQLAEQAGGLERTIESLLDFSRAGAAPEGRPEVIELLELLAPPLQGSGVSVTGQARGEVIVDVALIRRALGVLRRAELDPDRPLEIDAAGDEIVVGLHLCRLDTFEGDVARSVGEQLAVAGGAHVERDGGCVRLRLPRASRAAEGAS